MRVATYSQRTAATRASIVAIGLLVLTIFQGSSALLTLIYHFEKSLEPISVLLWLICYVVALGGLMLTHGLNWIFWLSRYRFLLVILLFGTAASIGWSIDANITTTRVLHLLGSCFIAIYLGFMVPLATTLTVMAWTLGVILLASVAAVFALPSLGIESYEGSQVWRGIVTSKNTLGFWSAVAVLLYVSQLSRAQTLLGKFTCLGMVAVSLGTLYFSHSATSLLAMVIGGSVALYFFLAIRFQLGFVRMVIRAMLFTALVAIAFLNIDTAELVGRSGDLTGRGEVWQQTWKLILDKPLTGYGYGAIWNPNDATIWIQKKLTDFTWVVYHAHNGFLQVASEIGLPLTCIALLMVVQQLIEIFYCQYQRQQLGVLFVLGFVITYLVSNYSEARFLVNRELYWIMFLALPISMLRQVTVVMPAEPLQDDDTEPDTPAPDPENTQRDTAVVNRREQKNQLKNRVKSIESLPAANQAAANQPAANQAAANQATGTASAKAADSTLVQRLSEQNLDELFEPGTETADKPVAKATGQDQFASEPDQPIEPDHLTKPDYLGDDRFDKLADVDFDVDVGSDPVDFELDEADIDMNSPTGAARRKR